MSQESSVRTAKLPQVTSRGGLWLLAAVVWLVTTAARLATLAVFAHERGSTVREQLLRWDSKHYLRIAEQGYFAGPPIGHDAPEHTLLAFFPALPGVMRAGHALGLDYVHTADLFNSVMTLALVAGAMAIAAHLGARTRGMLAAGVLVAAVPMSITYSMVYTEAAFAALTFWALWAILKRNWWLAGALTFLAGFFRLTALDLWVVLVIAVLIYARTNWKAWLAAVLSPLSFIAYLLWASVHSAQWGGYFALQKQGWNSSFDFGLATLKFIRKTLLTSDHAGYHLSVFVMAAAVLTVLLTIRRAPLPLWLFGAALSANVLLSDGVMHSRPRLLMPVVVLLIPALVHWSERAAKRDYWALLAGWIMVGVVFSAYMLVVFKWAI